MKGLDIPDGHSTGQPGRTAESLPRRRPLLCFFVLAYGVSWLLWLPAMVQGAPTFTEPYGVPTLWILPGIALGTTGVAFLMTRLTQGRAGVRRLLHRYAIWRVGLHWFLFAVLALPVLKVLTGYLLPEGEGALRAFLPGSLALYPVAYLSHFVFGPLWEEAAWRGFALPRLQHRHGPLRGTLILGLLWAFWHMPIYLSSGIRSAGLAAGLASFGQFVVVATSMAFIFTWLFNHTMGSLLPVILLHGSIDGTATYIQTLAVKGVIPQAAAASIEQGLVYSVIGLAVLLAAATRGRLGYGGYRKTAEALDLHPGQKD